MLSKTKANIIYYITLVVGVLFLFLSAYYWWRTFPQVPLIFLLSFDIARVSLDYFFREHTKNKTILFSIAILVLIIAVGGITLYPSAYFYFILIALPGVLIHFWLNYSEKQKLKNQNSAQTNTTPI